MRLKLNEDRFWEHADRDTVASVINGLGADEFAILEQDDDNYIQVYRNDDGTLQFEYREGGAGRHFEAAGDAVIDTEIVADAFTRYLAGDARWKGCCDWERMAFE